MIKPNKPVKFFRLSLFLFIAVSIRLLPMILFTKPNDFNGRFRNFLNKNFLKIIYLNALFKNAFIKTLKISNTRIKLLKGNSKMALLEEFLSEFFVPSLECSGFLLVCLKVSKEETPQHLLCQCSVTHTAQKCFLIFRGNFLCSSLFPLPFSWQWAWQPSLFSLCTLPSGIYRHRSNTPWIYSLPDCAFPNFILSI